ncbi:hypothetical protein JB92DRAFT_2894772 [Gautieria morchelliformis]|nr:hypothetical protein JB92DRAFT_2894772 [Gautieria morchelliformis]
MSDKDSLFGSPPPSPARGRSPSLALPESSGWRLDAQTSSQNVGTIALPGSQSLSSKLPVFLNPALPSENRVLQLRPPAQQAPRRRGTSHAETPAPALQNARTDRTLRDLVGLVSHFEPVATASASKPPPIAVPLPRASYAPGWPPPGSAQNPIEIDGAPGPADAVNSALIALAGTVANALKLPTTHQEVPLSKPTVNNVLYCIKHDPKLIPALQATYEYLGSIPNNSQLPPRSFSHVTGSQSDTSSSKNKKRKRKNSGPPVPAGAGHWDIAFPCAPRQESGHSPEWHLERGRRMLGELLGLFERGFAKVREGEAAKSGMAPSQQRKKKPRTPGIESVPRCGAEGPIAPSSDTGSKPGADAEGGGLDYERMADWLSSVSPLPTSSIIDSTNTTDTPCPSSDPASLSSNNLFDFIAMLGPNPADAQTAQVDITDDDFDFAGAFDGFDTGIELNDSTWEAMLGSVPAPQSMNDITAFSIPDIQSAAVQSGINELVLDPALALQSTHGVPSAQSAQTPALPPESQDATFQPAASGALSSLVDSAAGPLQCDARAGTEVEFTDTQSVDAPTLPTVSTASGSSSQRGATPSTCAPSPISPAPSGSAALSAAGAARPSKVERRAAVLARAREHRAQLLKELERARVQRWELLIEGGVLRNLEKDGAQ